MKDQEFSEIRRRLRPEKNNIGRVRGCYVNEKGEVISLLDQPLSQMTQEETETYLGLFKRTLSGAPDRNLIDIAFSTRQVADSDEHRLLMALRNSELRDEGAVQEFYRRVIQTFHPEGNYLILLAHDTYDVPYRAKDGEKQEDASSEVYSYILCAVCPVKLTRPALSYFMRENEFHSREAGWIVAPPELGFLFPAFDNRSTNLYNAVYYTHSLEENHSEFTDLIFHTELPMPAAVQKETFQSLLGDTLAEECSYQVVQAVHEQMSEKLEEQKADRDADPAVVSGREVRQVLESCGVSDTRADAFEEKFSAAFGEDADLSPRNLAESKQMEITMPDVVIRVNPERSDLVETRVLEGRKYILIHADEGVEVNGVPIHIADGQ